MDFTHAGIRYNILYISTLDWLQLYVDEPGHGWEFGHSKPVPEGMTVSQATSCMRDYITGRIDHATYNVMMPEPVLVRRKA